MAPGRRLPRLLLASSLCLSFAAAITALGVGLDLLPENFGVEWNGLPLSEYGLADVAGGIVLFGLAGSLLAGIHLRRGRADAPGFRRRLALGLLLGGLAPLVAVVAVVALALAVCSGGACA